MREWLSVLVLCGCGAAGQLGPETPTRDEEVEETATEVEQESVADAPAVDGWSCEMEWRVDGWSEVGRAVFRFDAQGRVIEQHRRRDEDEPTYIERRTYEQGAPTNLQMERVWSDGETDETRAATISIEPGNDPHQIVERQQFDDGTVTRVVWVFDEDGRVIRREEEPEAGSIRTCEWDANGRPTRVVAEDGTITTYAYELGGPWPIRVDVRPPEEDASTGVVAVSPGRIELVYPDDEGFNRYETYTGRCEQAFYASCSSAFAPPPPR